MCVLLGFLQKTSAIPIMNPLSWFMISSIDGINNYKIFKKLSRYSTIPYFAF